ncbi:MAG TPA: flavodoxin family protein [Patescibacteria group bacterium]|nr:flavodoxin family protein [Patescibacteria group bacterium]
MKNTVVILGSPRKMGNSAILAYKAIEGIIAAGGTYEVFHLNSMNIKPCQACEFCRKNSNKHCIVNDDMQLIYKKLDEADALFLPVLSICLLLPHS